MIADEERALLAEYLASCARLASTFDDLVDRMASLLPTDVNGVDRFAGEEHFAILAFLKSYEQFEETLQRTLKTIIQVMEQGKIERLTSVDIANRGASLGAIKDEQLWSDAVRTRNKLAHEYPTRPDKRVEQLNDAWRHRDTLRDVWRDIREFVVTEKLQ